jgi:hypothetical protein
MQPVIAPWLAGADAQLEGRRHGREFSEIFGSHGIFSLVDDVTLWLAHSSNHRV